MRTDGKIYKDIDNFKKIVSESFSIRDVYTKLGYKESGGIYKYIRIAIQKLELDTSHFTGSLWSKGKTAKSDDRVAAAAKRQRLPFTLIFCKDSTYRGHNQNLLKRLVNEGLKTYHCEECGISEWQSKPLTLHLDHIDGDNVNNSLDNLRILCPNCHTQTPTFSIGLRK